MAQYQMPEVYPGCGVLWYHGGDKSLKPYFGLVTRVGPRTVTVACFDPGVRMLVIFDGVRHMSDPDTKQPELIENGAWDYAPGEERIHGLAKKVEELTRRLATLEKGK